MEEFSDRKDLASVCTDYLNLPAATQVASAKKWWGDCCPAEQSQMRERERERERPERDSSGKPDSKPSPNGRFTELLMLIVGLTAFYNSLIEFNQLVK